MISILYVDDEPDLLELAQIFLEQTGEFRVRTSTSAEEVLADPGILSFDAILSDYQMPGMDGIAFLKEIRRKAPELPFLLFTGRGREEVVIEALNNGADFYIQKGGDPKAQFAELANKIRYAVERKRAERELQKKSDELNASYEQIAANEEELRQQLDELTVKQDALKISEEKFRAFTENVPDLTTISDINGNYQYISPSIQRITGQNANALLGSKYTGVSSFFGIVREDEEILLASGRNAMKKPGEPVPVPPFRVRDSQGGTVFIEGTITYLPDVKGIQGLLFHGRNITDRIKAEEEIDRKNRELRLSYEQLTASEEELRGQYEELSFSEKRIRESEEKFRTLFEKIHEALIIYTERRFTDCNQRALELFGYASKEEFLTLEPKDIFPLVQPDGKNSVRCGETHFRKALLEGSDHFEWVHKKKDGNLFSADVLLSRFELDGKQMVLASIRDISDRKRAEEQLELLKISVDQSSDEVFWLDFEGSILYVNDAACRTTGYSREELCSMKLFALDPDFSQEVWGASIADLREKKTQFIQTRHRRKDGTLIDVEIVAVYVSKGDREYSFAFVRDISGRKRTEQTLAESEERYRTLVDSSFDGIAIHQDGKLVFVNQTGVRMMGLSDPAGLIGRPAIEIIHPDDRALIAERIRVSPEKSLELIHERFLRADGSTIDVDVATTPCTWQGRPATYVTFRDISIQKKAEAALRESEENYRSLIELAPIAIVVHRDGKNVYANPEAVRMIKAKVPEDIIGKDILTFVSPDYQARTLGAIRKMSEEGVMLPPQEQRIVAVDGEVLTVEIAAKPVNFQGLPSIMVLMRDITKRKKAEEALFNSQQMLQSVLDTIPQRVFWKDRDSVFLGCNRQNARDAGFSDPSEMVGKTDFDYTTRDVADLYRADDHQVMETGEGRINYEEPQVRPDGSTAWLRTSKVPLRDKEGNVVGVLGTYEDITEYKRSQEALRESEERYRTLIDTSFDGIAIHQNGKLVFVNQTGASMIGVSDPASLIGKPAIEIIHPDDRTLIAERIRVSPEKTLDLLHERFVRTDGSAVDVDVATTPCTWQGEPATYVTFRDISVQKRAEDALRESEENFRSLIELAPIAIIVHRNGKNVYANPEAFRMVKANVPEDIIGRDILTFVNPEYHARTMESVRRMSEGGISFPRQEQGIIASDGEELTVEIAAKPVNFQGFPSVMVLMRDITKRKKAEEALFNSQQMLQSVLNTIPQRVFWKDKNSVFLGCNKSLAQDAGLSDPSELIGKTDYDNSFRETADLYRADDRQVMETGLSRINYEKPQVRPDGSRAWLRTSKVPLRDKEGNVAGVLGTYEDITEYKRSLEALRESEERFRNIVETTSEWIWEMDLAGHHTFSNPAIERIIGYSLGEIQATDINELLHPDDQNMVKELLEASIRLKKGWRDVVVRWRHKNGSWCYLESNSIPVFDSDGTLTGFRGADRDITQRKGAEQALRESEEKYRTLVENAHEAIAIVQEWKIVFVNQRGADMLGRPVSEVEGQMFMDFIWPEDRDRLKDLHAKRIAGASVPQTYDFRITGAGGRPVWVSNSTTGISWQGKPSTLSLMTDITERKFAEAALKESEETFRRVIEGAPEAIYIGADWKFVYLNPAALRLMGATSGNPLIGTPFLDRIHPRFHEAIKNRVNGLYHEKVAASTLEEVYVRLDGTEVEVEVSAVPFRYMGKDGALVFVWDITGRKRAEQARRESETEYRRILDTMQDAYIRVDAEGKIIMVNPSAARMFKYASPQEMRGIPIVSLYSNPAKRQEIVTRLEKDGMVTDIVEMMLRMDSTTFWASINVQAIRGEDGRLSGTEGIIRDVTERTALEQAIQDTNKKLNLLNSITRHDVANQLTALQGYAQLAEMSTPDPVVLDFLQKIGAASDMIARQIEFTKAYQELGVKTPGWFRLEEIVEKTARPEVSFSNTCRAIEVFAGPMIERVFFNLFDNAMRHGEHVTMIGIRCERAPDGLVIYVEDDGIGVVPEEKEKIFEKGYGKNTGFGLFLAREILATTGITIRETGYVGVGARFEITVPKEMWRIFPGGG